jgi:hypothetical protein
VLHTAAAAGSTAALLLVLLPSAALLPPTSAPSVRDPAAQPLALPAIPTAVRPIFVVRSHTACTAPYSTVTHAPYSSSSRIRYMRMNKSPLPGRPLPQSLVRRPCAPPPAHDEARNNEPDKQDGYYGCLMMACHSGHAVAVQFLENYASTASSTEHTHALLLTHCDASVSDSIHSKAAVPGSYIV